MDQDTPRPAEDPPKLENDQLILPEMNEKSPVQLSTRITRNCHEVELFHWSMWGSRTSDKCSFMIVIKFKVMSPVRISDDY